MPDFLLVHPECTNVVCEVKCVNAAKDSIGLALLQASMLDAIARHGGAACVLALCAPSSMWAGFHAGKLEVACRFNTNELTWDRGVFTRILTSGFVNKLIS